MALTRINHNTMPSGSILQVQSAFTNATGNSSSTTFTASGLQVSITPKSTSSKIFLTVSGGTLYVPSGKYVYGKSIEILLI